VVAYEPDAFDETEDLEEVKPDPAATRLINLTLALMSSSTPRTREDIFRLVEGYGPAERPSDASLRMFERDKDALRELGLPLQVTENDAGNPISYVLRRTDALLPELHLDPEQRTVVALAARAWTESALSSTGSSALRKLAADAAPENPAPWLDPRLDGADPAFRPLVQAAVNRKRVRFDYQTPESIESATRTLDVWGLTAWRGRWYVSGHDADRDDRRIFRLSRITSAVEDLGPAEVLPPDGYEPSHEVERFAHHSHGEVTKAEVRIRQGKVLSMRTRAIEVSDNGDGWDKVVLEYAFLEGFADAITGWGADIVVDGPAELREAVLTRLTRLAELA
jgi:proteasome accessory factor B